MSTCSLAYGIGLNGLETRAVDRALATKKLLPPRLVDDFEVHLVPITLTARTRLVRSLTGGTTGTTAVTTLNGWAQLWLLRVIGDVTRL